MLLQQCSLFGHNCVLKNNVFWKILGVFGPTHLLIALEQKKFIGLFIDMVLPKSQYIAFSINCLKISVR